MIRNADSVPLSALICFGRNKIPDFFPLCHDVTIGVHAFFYEAEVMWCCGECLQPSKWGSKTGSLWLSEYLNCWFLGRSAAKQQLGLSWQEVDGNSNCHSLQLWWAETISKHTSISREQPWGDAGHRLYSWRPEKHQVDLSHNYRHGIFHNCKLVSQFWWTRQ